MDHLGLYDALGFTVIQLPTGEKAPPNIGWQRTPRGSASRRLKNWPGNLGIATGSASGIVIVDCDSMDNARWAVENLKPVTRHAVVTPRGVHLYYRGSGIRNGAHVNNRYDIRGDGGYVVAPPSMVKGKPYRWGKNGPPRSIEDLPPFNPEWRAEERTKSYERNTDKADGDVLSRISRARAYIAKMEEAISGQGGHDATFKVAIVLCKDFNLTVDQAWPLMLEYNERCKPPWGRRALIHKLEDARAAT